MAKLKPNIVARLKQLGINTDDETIARKKLIKILANNDVNDCDEDPTDSLIEMAMVFKDTVEAGGDEDEEEVEEEVEEVDEEEEEEEEEEEPVVKKGKKAAPASAKAKKPVKKAAPVEEEEEEEEVDEEEEMEELAKEVKKKGLKSKPAAAPATPKKPAKKQAASDDEEEGEGSGGARKRKLQGRHWKDLTDKEKEKALVPFRKVFPKDKFSIKLLQQSFTVAYLGKTSEQNICKYHLLRLLDDGTLEGVFVTHRFKEPEEFAAYLPEKLVKQRTLKKGDSCSYIHPLSQEEVMELINDTDWLADSIKAAEKQDKKMQVNRANLEQTLNSGKDKKSEVKKPVKKVAVEEDDEEEEEEPAPAKSKSAKAGKPVKKSVVIANIPEDEEEEEEEPAPAKKKSVKKAVKK